MFNINIPTKVETIIECLELNGYEAYIVGGCVRDSLLGKIPNDWDITTNATPNEIINIFEKTIPTGIKHGTVTVLVDNIPFEVTTYRIDGEYSDGRHPDSVKFTESINKDLSRRDFTINAMAYNTKKGVVDIFDGCKDLNKKLIRCVGNPSSRFEEDALRMLRAIRFSAQLNFTIEETTINSIKEKSPLIKEVSIERIQSEINKILLFDSSKLYLLKKVGLLEYIIPEICDDLSEILIFTNNIESNLHLKLTMLFRNMSLDSIHYVLRRLRYDNKTINRVLILSKYRDYNIELDRISIKRILNKLGDLTLFEDLIKLKMANLSNKDPEILNLLNIQKRANIIIQQKECFMIKDLALNGKDLISIGVNRGREIGETLDKLLEIVIEKPELNNKDELSKIVLEMIN